MTNADVSEISRGVTPRKSWIWVETPRSTFVSLTACLKVEVLRSSSHQSRSNITILSRAELSWGEVRKTVDLLDHI